MTFGYTLVARELPVPQNWEVSFEFLVWSFRSAEPAITTFFMSSGGLHPLQS